MCYRNDVIRMMLSAVLVFVAALPAFAIVDFYGSDTPTGAALGFVSEGGEELRRKELHSTADINLLSNVIYAINGAPVGNNQTVDVGGTNVFFESIVDSLNANHTFTNTAAGNYYNVDTGNAELNAVLNSQVYNGTMPTVTLNNLIPGETYRVQVLGAADTRGFTQDENDPSIYTQTGNSAKLHDISDGIGGYESRIDRLIDVDGDFVFRGSTGIADFTADDTTQVLQMGLSQAGSAFSGLVVSTDSAEAHDTAGLPALTIDRSTGQITLSNDHPTGSFEFTSVSLTSDAGSINSGSTPGATLGPGQQVILDETWEQTPFQDVAFELTLAGESPRSFSVLYAGTAIGSGDLNGDGTVDGTDWTQFKDGSNIDMAGFTAVAAYQNGDLDGDLVQNLADFALFQTAFDAANGAGALAAVMAVPEPSTIALAAMCLVGVVASRRRLSRQSTAVVTATAAVALMAFSSAVVSADTIDWRNSVNMYQGATVQTFVDTTGDLAVAYNNTLDITSGDTAVTVNGVAFTPQNTGIALVGGTGESITINGGTDNTTAFQDGEFNGDASIYHLIRGGTYGVPSITLDGLEIGQTYSLQVFNNDARGSRHLNFITGYGDGSGSTEPVAFSELNNSPVDGSAPVLPQTEVGDSIIGTFTPELSTTLTFNIFGSTGGLEGTFTQGDGRAQINAIQLRRIPDLPDPLELIVNTTTGNITIANNGSLPVTFDAYEILSDGGNGTSLDEDGWFPIADGAGAALGFPQGTGSGDGWEASPNADSGGLMEWHLQSTGGGDADFDADGDIDGLDFLTWQQYVGYTAPINLQPFGDANRDDAIDGADLVIWEGQYGGDASGPVTPPLGPGESISISNAYDESVNAQDLTFSYRRLDGVIEEGVISYVSAIAAVPEPSSVALAAIFGIAILWTSRTSSVLRGRATR